jgi:hypothetical protein
MFSRPGKRPGFFIFSTGVRQVRQVRQVGQQHKNCRANCPVIRSDTTATQILQSIKNGKQPSGSKKFQVFLYKDCKFLIFVLFL